MLSLIATSKEVAPPSTAVLATHSQQQRLESLGNSCDRWQDFYFTSEQAAEVATAAAGKIRGCTFLLGAAGCVVIGDLSGDVDIGEGISLSCGIYNSSIFGTCVFGDHCRVSDTQVLKNVAMSARAAVLGCGKVYCQDDTSTHFGNYTTICVGPENGGRQVLLHVSKSFQCLTKEALGGGEVEEGGSGSDSWSSRCTIIAEGALLMHCVSIKNSFIGAYSIVESSNLENCTLDSSLERPISIKGNAHLTSCIFGQGTSAFRCIAEAVFVTESASIGENARLSNSVLGPDANVTGGECHHCLLGPFVGFHHHSLLIASLWPLGRGNLGYGAMVGANHTGRVNDQECWPGEGCFFGLGSAIKFPSNYLASPYSIVAAGTQMLPQRVSFPFSLFLSSGRGEGEVRIKPAWMLYANPYMIERAEAKFRKRRKAKQHHTGFGVVRPGNVDLVRAALARLLNCVPFPREAAAGSEVMATEANVSGLGKCVLSSNDYNLAIDAYTNFVRRYALHGLLYMLLTKSQQEDRAETLSPHGGATTSAPVVAADEEGDVVLRNGEAIDAASPLEAIEVDLLSQVEERDERFPFLVASTARHVLKHQWAVLQENYADFFVANPSCTFSSPYEAAPLLHQHLMTLERAHAAAVQLCKERDDTRGKLVIPDYERVNVSCIATQTNGGDDVVCKAHERTKEIEAAIAKLL